ncbi:unnamed protein product [Lampetra planeri]
MRRGIDSPLSGDLPVSRLGYESEEPGGGIQNERFGEGLGVMGTVAIAWPGTTPERCARYGASAAGCRPRAHYARAVLHGSCRVSAGRSSQRHGEEEEVVEVEQMQAPRACTRRSATPRALLLPQQMLLGHNSRAERAVTTTTATTITIPTNNSSGSSSNNDGRDQRGSVFVFVLLEKGEGRAGLEWRHGLMPSARLVVHPLWSRGLQQEVGRRAGRWRAVSRLATWLPAVETGRTLLMLLLMMLLLLHGARAAACLDGPSPRRAELAPTLSGDATQI